MKELNYFDGVPILSAEKGVGNMQQVEVGSFQQGTISKVEKDYVVISLSDSVSGRLHLEHMGD